MSSNGYEPPMEALDRQILREIDRITSGAAAHHRAMAPDEAMMLSEEDGDDGERDALREEIFAGMCDWTLGKGLHPREIRERLEAVMWRFAPDLCSAMTGKDTVWWDEAAVVRVMDGLSGRAAEPSFDYLHLLSSKIREEVDKRFVYQSFNGLCRFWVGEGMEWRKAVGAHLIVVKALRPQLLGGASLDEIAVLCGDGGKATVSARCKRMFSARLEQMGFQGTHAHFQKSPEAVEAYRRAQMGNSNRRKK